MAFICSVAPLGENCRVIQGQLSPKFRHIQEGREFVTCANYGEFGLRVVQLPTLSCSGCLTTHKISKRGSKCITANLESIIAFL